MAVLLESINLYPLPLSDTCHLDHIDQVFGGEAHMAAIDGPQIKTPVPTMHGSMMYPSITTHARKRLLPMNCVILITR